MKCRAFSLVCMLAAASLQASPKIERSVVRQQWPWSDGVKVEFLLTGVDAPVDVKVSFSVNGTDVEIPEDAVGGRRYCLTTDGAYALMIDPARVPALANVARTATLDASLSVSAAGDYGKEVLYRALKLEDNTWLEITRGEILNGDYGSYVTDYGRVGEGYSTTLSDVCIWTGVTNDVKWISDYVVLRKIPRGKFDFKPLYNSSWLPQTANLSEITYDYWIGVFPMTQAQYEKIYVEGNPKATPWYGNDGAEHYYEYGNIYTNRYFPVHCLHTPQLTGHWISSHPSNFQYADGNISRYVFFGRLYTRTGLKFRFPKLFEWSRAERAGAPLNSYYYDGASLCTISGSTVKFLTVKGDVTSNDAADVLGRYQSNGGADGLARVGSYRPNAFGLYDMFGNVSEISQDTLFTNNSGQTGNVTMDEVKAGFKDWTGHSNGPGDGAVNYNNSAPGGWYGLSASLNEFGSGLHCAQYHKTTVRLERIGFRLCISDVDFVLQK